MPIDYLFNISYKKTLVNYYIKINKHHKDGKNHPYGIGYIY